jgi:hypothetical protein
MTSSTGGGRTLQFRTGGWVILLAALVWLAALAWWLLPLDLSVRRAEPNNGFDLSISLVPADTIVPSGQPRDGIRSMDGPGILTTVEVLQLNEEQRGKYLVDSDEVIGVRIGDEVRAYPIRVLNWHEVVNDVVGGTPIAVTFGPLTFGTAVFDRNVGTETLEFGVSGLLHDSGLLLYDRGGGSLWSQLQARAVTGPAAERGEVLEPLPFSLTTWGTWRERYPETTTVAPLPALKKHYSNNPYGNYYQQARPRFPVDPLPEDDGPGLMTRVLAVRTDDGGWALTVLDPNASKPALPGGIGEGITFGFERESVGFLADDARAEMMVALWFAWYATHPEDAPPPW